MAMYHQPDPDWTWMGDEFLSASEMSDYYDDDERDEDDCND